MLRQQRVMLLMIVGGAGAIRHGNVTAFALRATGSNCGEETRARVENGLGRILEDHQEGGLST